MWWRIFLISISLKLSLGFFFDNLLNSRKRAFGFSPLSNCGLSDESSLLSICLFFLHLAINLFSQMLLQHAYHTGRFELYGRFFDFGWWLQHFHFYQIFFLVKIVVQKTFCNWRDTLGWWQDYWTLLSLSHHHRCFSALPLSRHERSTRCLWHTFMSFARSWSETGWALVRYLRWLKLWNLADIRT